MINPECHLGRSLRGSLQGLLFGGLVSGGLLGCKDLTGGTSLPAGTRDPVVFHTPAGALGMRAIALQTFEQALPSYLLDTGLLTDELESNQTGVAKSIFAASSLPAGGSLDARILPEPSYGGGETVADNDYTGLQRVRGLTAQALGALATYDTGAIRQGDPVALRSQLFALAGYTELLLADFFCSGVPLSTLDFQQDYTYHAGSTTDAVYQDALTKLDSAYALAQAADSMGLLRLAQVLRGRAWLARGPQYYDSAAAAVASVPDTFQYRLPVDLGRSNGDLNWVTTSGTVSDREGGTGLPYLSSATAGDPRLAVTTTREAGCSSNGKVCYAMPLTIPTKYLGSLDGTGFMPFTLADGIEARLIQAEVALHTIPNAPTWLGLLNQLRATALIPGTSAPNAAALPPLTDPGPSPNEQTRVALLFQERAYWLFLTGHREGDLRRLMRHYGKAQQQAYPTGAYLAPGIGRYGRDVTAPIPGTEYLNPLFQGCLSRGA